MPAMMDRILMDDGPRGDRGGGRRRRGRASARRPSARGEPTPSPPEARTPRPSALDLPITTEKIDDPVRMYLTQMGEIPLLTRDEEISLSKKIEITRKRYRHRVLDSGVGIAGASASCRRSRAATSPSTARCASAPPTRSARTTSRSACRSTCARSRRIDAALRHRHGGGLPAGVRARSARCR